MLISKVITLQKSTFVFYLKVDSKINPRYILPKNYNLAGSTHLKIWDS